MNRTFVIALAFLCLAAVTHAQDTASDVAKGKILAESNCAMCHATGTTGTSAMQVAPAFRDMALGYDPSELEDAFNEGVSTDHPAMPDWQLTPEEARQLSAYIMSLRTVGKLRTDFQMP